MLTPARSAGFRHSSRLAQTAPCRRTGNSKLHTKLHPARVATTSDVGAPSSSTAQGVDLPLVCPICFETKFAKVQPRRLAPLFCPRCTRTFQPKRDYMDLTLTSGVQQKLYKGQSWGGQETFRSPVVSWLYERGWRQQFATAGFPGADREYDLAMSYMEPAFGQVLVDMSCGSGLFTRRFARSGKFSTVIAADFSETMLQQTRIFLDEGPQIKSSEVVLVRADVARLPFATGSVAALHAGAAMHCWPDPQAGMADISRSLQPGGIYVASTFLLPTAPLGQLFGDDTVRPLTQLTRRSESRLGFRYWEEQELRELCATVGLVNFTCTRSNHFIMFCAQKPGGKGR